MGLRGFDSAWVSANGGRARTEARDSLSQGLVARLGCVQGSVIARAKAMTRVRERTARAYCGTMAHLVAVRVRVSRLGLGLGLGLGLV